MGKTSWLYELSDRDRLRFEVAYDRERVYRTSVQLECAIEGEYRPVVRYDNAHEFCHQDRLWPDGRTEKTTIAVPPAELATLAQQDLREN
ncbi:MAG: hypothetical protein HY331_13730 [Chloroflexi bacterium]|nr:hypothetical protein [Chloroflexota bacterium]